MSLGVDLETLLRDFSIGGNLIDGERLRSIAQLQGRSAWPLLEQALAAGSIPVRAAALEAMICIDAAAAEPLAAALLRAEGPLDVRASAVAALAAAGSDGALDALLAVLREGPTAFGVGEALDRGFPHERHTRRMMELWDALLGRAFGPDAARTPKCELDALLTLGEILLRRRPGAIEPALRRLWRDHPVALVRDRAARQILALGGFERALLILKEGVPGNNEIVQPNDEVFVPRDLLLAAAREAFGAPAADAFDALHTFLRPEHTTTPFGLWRARLLLSLLLCQLGHDASVWIGMHSVCQEMMARPSPDPRWADVCGALAGPLQTIGGEVAARLRGQE